MRTFVWGALALACLTMPAFAGDPLAGFYGNTVIMTSPKGELKVAYKPDHTYNAIEPSGKAAAGTWAMKNDQLCTLRTNPPPEPGHGEFCRAVPADKKVGDTWDGTNRQGEKVTFKLIAGQ